MQNFILHTPTKILFGKDQIAEVAGQIPADARILITYGGGSVKKNGVLDQVYSALAGRDVREFSGIEPNPTYETLMKAVEVVKAENIDFLLAVGGGSVVDGTKFIAAAARYTANGDAWHILQTVGSHIADAVPMGCVLTLPATGSESNSGAVITRKSSGDKQHFFSPLVQPRFAVLDPVVTYSLPPRQIANGVVDAFVHTLEQYLTYPVDAKVQDRFAEGLLLTLLEDGPRAGRTGKLCGARQRDVERHHGAERPDRRRGAAGLGNPHAGPRADRHARSRPRANAGHRAAGAAAREESAEARKTAAVR